MSDDLKQNLRGSCYLAFEDNTNDYETAPEAADRIDELEGQLKTVLDRETSILRYYDAKLDAADTKLAVAVEASVEAVWAEYTDSVESKWTFRKEHIQNAILRTLAELKGKQP